MGGGRTEVLIALGGNQGDRRANLRAAIDQLPPAVTVDACSDVYETAPMYVADQPAFLNMVVRGWTALAPTALLQRLKAVERAVGRVETFRNGPRVIDLDILYYGERLLRERDLEIPHPRIEERAFVLAPLADVAAEWIDPRTGRTIAAMLADVRGRETVQAARPRRLDQTTRQR